MSWMASTSIALSPMGGRKCSGREAGRTPHTRLRRQASRVRPSLRSAKGPAKLNERVTRSSKGDDRASGGTTGPITSIPDPAEP